MRDIRPAGIVVEVKNGDIDHAVRRFLQKVRNERIHDDVRQRADGVSRAGRKRLKRARAKSRRLQEEQRLKCPQTQESRK